MGDDLGWKAALPITLLMVHMPLMLTLGKRIRIFLSSRSLARSRDNNNDNKDGESNMEISIKIENEENIREASVIELTKVSDCNSKSDIPYIIKNPLLV